ncbi:MAG: hypothetical protein ACXIUD_11560 [Mongoliitalea sp.]
MKNIFKISASILLLTLFINGCKQDQVDENQMLKQEVIDIHDEVMPRMGELRSLKKSLLEKVEALEAASADANATDIERLRVYADDLEDAFEGMFVWMRQFQSNFEGTEEEVHQYLLEQKLLVEKVNRDIKSSIENAKKELGS